MIEVDRSEANTQILRCAEDGVFAQDFVDTLVAAKFRISPNDPQYDDLLECLTAPGSEHLVGILEPLVRLGLSLDGLDWLLAYHADHPAAVRLLLALGADPNAGAGGSYRYRPTRPGIVFDDALSGPRGDEAGHRASLALMAPYAATPLSPAVVDEIVRLGGTLPAREAWQPNRTTFPRAMWTLSNVRWPANTILSGENVSDFRPSSLDAWTERSGWSVAPHLTSMLWLWATTAIQDMIALRLSQRGRITWHALRHDRENQPDLGIELSVALARLSR